MKTISSEKLIEKMKVDLYPITMVKFLLNKRRILSYFSKAADKDFEIRGLQYKINHEGCEHYGSKDDGILCRQHTSIQRILEAKEVACDIDTQAYFYKNEIFRMISGKLVIVYCPHPKLIAGDITDAKVRKINTITIEDKSLELPKYELREFISSDLMDQHLKCWFNNQFSIVTIPNDRNFSDFCLIPNH